MHAATIALLTKNATIFWEHEVFVGCCQFVIATRQFKFFLYFFFEKV